MHRLGIVAHASRAAAARELARSTRASFISVDGGGIGCEGNHRIVQEHLSRYPSSWSVICEDDALAVPDIAEQLPAALLMAPAPIVSFYLGRSRPRHAQRKIAAALQQADAADAHWIVATRLLHAVAYAVRTDLLASLLAHESTLPADEHVTSWARRYGHTVAYSVGSLFEHTDGPTVVAHPDRQPRLPGRRAWRLGGRQYWTSTAVTMP